jgi:hypothetical protein
VCCVPQERCLEPLLHARHHNYRPIRQQNDKKTLSHRPLDRVRKANEPKGDRTCPELLRLKGVTSHGSGDYEVDHLISLELEGSNSNEISLTGVLIAVPLKTIVEIRFKAGIVVALKRND